MSYGYNTYQPPYKPIYGQQPQYQPIPLQQYQQPQPVQPQQWQQTEPAPAQPVAPQEPPAATPLPDSNEHLAQAIDRLCELLETLYGDYRKEVQKIWTSDR